MLRTSNSKSGSCVHQLSVESFNGGTSGSALGHGQYSYSYDGRGEQTQQTISLGGTSYSFSTPHDDAGMLQSLIYSDGEIASWAYDPSSGAIISVSDTPQGGSNPVENLADTLVYNANDQVTSAYVGGQKYGYSAGYDLDARLSSSSLVTRGSNVTDFATSRSYDAVGNVLTVNTTLAGGTDHQAFCYDEQNRLTWASSVSATPPCGGSLSTGTLTSAAYGPVGYSYDALNRLTSSSSGSETYGDSTHHLDAATSIGSSYTASYDAAGNMTCRATTSSQTCGGTPTGQVLSYDNEGRMTAWQNQPTSPTAMEQMAYDGEGNRVALVVNWGTPTYYLSNLEEISGATMTKYLRPGLGLPTGIRSGTGSLVFTATDGLGSMDEALDGNGNVTLQELFTPYGTVRYSSGSYPTSYTFTGQRADYASVLYYFNARYYDPVGQQFVSADTAQNGLNRYAYVHGNLSCCCLACQKGS